jgi:hypothetical protein
LPPLFILSRAQTDEPTTLGKNAEQSMATKKSLVRVVEGTLLLVDRRGSQSLRFCLSLFSSSGRRGKMDPSSPPWLAFSAPRLAMPQPLATAVSDGNGLDSPNAARDSYSSVLDSIDNARSRVFWQAKQGTQINI